MIDGEKIYNNVVASILEILDNDKFDFGVNATWKGKLDYIKSYIREHYKLKNTKHNEQIEETIVYDEYEDWDD